MTFWDSLEEILCLVSLDPCVKVLNVVKLTSAVINKGRFA